MIALRAGAVVVTLGGVFGVFACGAFGEGSASPPATDGGGIDGNIGADAGGGDANVTADAAPPDAAPTPFCAGHNGALFCEDFEDGELPQSFLSVDKYGADTIKLALTAPPDRMLTVDWPAGASANGHRLEQPLSMPGIFEVSFELSALSGIGDQYIEIIDISSDSNENLAITARLNTGSVEALLAVPAANFDRTLSLGTLPTVPTRYTMKVTATHFVAQRGSDTPAQVALEVAAGGLQGACTLRVGVYYANAPAGGSFRIDDVLVAD